jgi:hypothetical protein
MKTKRFMQPVEILAPEARFIPGVAQSAQRKALTMQDSLQIKAAEYWLELGVEILEMWLGAQNPDCCIGSFEGARRDEGPGLN